MIDALLFPISSLFFYGHTIYIIITHLTALKTMKTKPSSPLSCITANDDPAQYNDDFPWESVAIRSSVGMSRTDKAVALKVSVGMGFAETAICRKLNVGMGRVMKAIVFDEISVGMSYVDNLHCLSSTKQSVGMGGVGKVTFHAVKELVEMAIQELDVSGETPIAENVSVKPDIPVAHVTKDV